MSGFNVGIVALVMMILLKVMRLARQPRFILCLASLILYCLLTGASNPVVRATVMVMLCLFAYWVKRSIDIYNSSAAAIFFILAINPNQLFDIGFQLSFASVLSIAYFYPRLRKIMHKASARIRILKACLESLLVSLSAWLGTLGLVAYHFQIFAPITVLANLFIVPLATFITLSGFSLIGAGIIYPPLAPYFAATCELLVSILVRINTLLLKIPGAYLRFS